MTLIRWSPAREVNSLRRDMERLFEDMVEPFGRRQWLPELADNGGIVPKVDILDKKNEIVIKAQLPGVEKDEVNLTVTKEAVTIKGEIKKEEEEKKADYYRSECTYGSYLRTISLPSGIDTAKAKASLKNGVLKITLPKHEEAKAKEVKLKVE